MEKVIFDTVLKRIRVGAVAVTYPDRTTTTYGTGKPVATIVFKNQKALRAILRNLTLGFGESYQRGDIEVNGPLDEIMGLMLQNQSAFNGLKYVGLVTPRNINRKSKQQEQIQWHYDLGNDFYKLWLDRSMTYSCAYFGSPRDSLEKAQERKVTHLLRKLQLVKGQRVLDIGSGWGTLLIRAAKEYGITGLGITLSQQQYEHSLAEAKKQDVDKQITFRLVNYQDLAAEKPQFDRIISVGMYEHVGRSAQKTYFDAVAAMLIDGGVSVLHTISNQDFLGNDPWIDKYIFPGGYIPNIKRIIEQFPGHDLHMTDYENLRIHYAMTLDEWWRRFEKHKDKVINKYGEEFYRMWRLYLASCAASFRYGNLDLSQVVFTKGINNDLPLTRDFLYPAK